MDFESASELNSDGNSETQELNRILNESESIEFGTNPHNESSKKYQTFESFKHCTTVTDAKANGASQWDLREYFKKGHLTITSAKSSANSQVKKELFSMNSPNVIDKQR